MSVLAARGASPFAFTAAAIRHFPAGELELIVDEARPGHGLYGRAALLAVAQDAIGERPQGVRVWVNG